MLGVGLVPEGEVVAPDGKRRREDEPARAAEVPLVGAGEVVEDVQGFHRDLRRMAC